MMWKGIKNRFLRKIVIESGRTFITYSMIKEAEWEEYKYCHNLHDEFLLFRFDVFDIKRKYVERHEEKEHPEFKDLVVNKLPKKIREKVKYGFQAQLPPDVCLYCWWEWDGRNG